MAEYDKVSPNNSDFKMSLIKRAHNLFVNKHFTPRFYAYWTEDEANRINLLDYRVHQEIDNGIQGSFAPGNVIKRPPVFGLIGLLELNPNAWNFAGRSFLSETNKKLTIKEFSETDQGFGAPEIFIDNAVDHTISLISNVQTFMISNQIFIIIFESLGDIIFNDGKTSKYTFQTTQITSEAAA